MTQRPKFRHYIEAIPLLVVPQLLRVLPFKLRVRVAGALISMLIRSIPSLRRRISANLELIYPNTPLAKRKRLARDIARNIGWGYVEMLFSRRYCQRVSHFHMQSSMQDIEEAAARGRPVILVSAHFGSWGAVRALLSKQFSPVGALFKRPGNPVLGRWYETVVGAGLPMFEVTPRGMAEMVRHLKKGGIVAILTDQHAPDGDWLDFMSVPAQTALSAAKLAIRTNALLIPCYGVRRHDIHDIDVYLEPPIPHGDPVEMTQKINDSLTARVLKNPEQWYWLHRRWKNDTDQDIDNT